jgi:hypothetical protein
MRISISAFAVSFFFLASSFAYADDVNNFNRPRFYLFASAAAGEQVSTILNGAWPSSGFGAGGGFGLGLEIPIIDWLSLGASLSPNALVLFEKRDLQGPNPQPSLVLGTWDISVYPKLSVGFGNEAAFGVYIKTPIGLSLSKTIRDSNFEDGIHKGFQVGAMVGAELLFLQTFGVFADIGYQFKSVSLQYPLSPRIEAHSAVANFGALAMF